MLSIRRRGFSTTRTPSSATVSVQGRSATAIGDSGSSGGGGSALFTDGFESGDLSYVENSIRWNGQANVSVQTTQASEGTRSARFRFAGNAPGGETTAELRFLLGASYPEIWIGYRLFIPSNYTHRAGGNNKGFFYAWDGGDAGYGSPRVGMGPNFWQNSNFGPSYNAISEFSFYVWGANSLGDFHYWRDMHPTRVLQPAITTADLGQWCDIVCQYKYATAANNDGVARIWKRPGRVGAWVQLLNITNGPWYSAGQQGFDVGYLLGYANSGFTNTTDFYMDYVQFAVSDIWGASG